MFNRIFRSSLLVVGYAFSVTFGGCATDAGITSSPTKPASDAAIHSDAKVDTAVDVHRADSSTTFVDGANATDTRQNSDGDDVQAADTNSGASDAAISWPTCDSKPSDVSEMTVPEVWQKNPLSPYPVWLSSLYITAISYEKCITGYACQLYLQDAQTYGSFAEGAHHGIKVFVSKRTAEHFSHLKVGDKVNVQGFAERSRLLPGQNELQITVRSAYPGCMKPIGKGNLVPIEGVELAALTVYAYEQTHGPLFVKVKDITGKPGQPHETFSLWKTGGPLSEGGVETVVSASPAFLPNGRFSGLPTSGTKRVNFASISGVFGLYIPHAETEANKYLMLNPRSNQDLVVKNP